MSKNASDEKPILSLLSARARKKIGLLHVALDLMERQYRLLLEPNVQLNPIERTIYGIACCWPGYIWLFNGFDNAIIFAKTGSSNFLCQGFYALEDYEMAQCAHFFSKFSRFLDMTIASKATLDQVVEKGFGFRCLYELGTVQKGVIDPGLATIQSKMEATGAHHSYYLEDVCLDCDDGKHNKGEWSGIRFDDLVWWNSWHADAPEWMSIRRDVVAWVERQVVNPSELQIPRGKGTYSRVSFSYYYHYLRMLLVIGDIETVESSVADFLAYSQSELYQSGLREDKLRESFYFESYPRATDCMLDAFSKWMEARNTSDTKTRENLAQGSLRAFMKLYEILFIQHDTIWHHENSHRYERFLCPTKSPALHPEFLLAFVMQVDLGVNRESCRRFARYFYPQLRAFPFIFEKLEELLVEYVPIQLHSESQLRDILEDAKRISRLYLAAQYARMATEEKGRNATVEEVQIEGRRYMNYDLSDEDALKALSVADQVHDIAIEVLSKVEV